MSLNNGEAIWFFPPQYRTTAAYQAAVDQNGLVLIDVPEDVHIEKVPKIDIGSMCIQTNPCKHC